MPAIHRRGDHISDYQRECSRVPDELPFHLALNGSSDVLANNKNVIRQTVDQTSGHYGGFVPTTFNSGSPNVFANSSSVVRNGDSIVPHTNSDSTHSGTAREDAINNYPSGGWESRCSPADQPINVFVNSGGGAGAIADNNIPIILNGTVNPSAPATPTNMQTSFTTEFMQANPHISAADIQFYETDDEDTASATPPSGTTVISRRAEQVDLTQAPTTTAPIHDCADVEALSDSFTWTSVSGSFDTWAQSFQLSTNFTVYDLTVGPAVSTYRFSSAVTQAVGLTQKQILRNMCYLANILLQPLYDFYGPFTITSCWRSATNGSQHNRGQAVDIQFLEFHNSTTTGRQYFQRAQEIRDTFNFDQMILEWFGKNPWIHLSVNPVAHRNQVLTQVGPNSYQAGLTLLS